MHVRAFLVSLPLFATASYVVACEDEHEHATTPTTGLGDIAGEATDEALQDMLAVAGGPIRAVVTPGLFDNNNKVTSGGGPFEGETISFEVSQ